MVLTHASRRTPPPDVMSQVPWNALGTQPVEVFMDRLFLLVAPKQESERATIETPVRFMCAGCWWGAIVKCAAWCGDGGASRMCAQFAGDCSVSRRCGLRCLTPVASCLQDDVEAAFQKDKRQRVARCEQSWVEVRVVL